MYKKDDIVVRLDNKYNGNEAIGSMYKVYNYDGGSYLDIYYSDNINMFHPELKHVRLATQEEIEAYNNGCRNISELDKYISSSNRLNELSDKWFFKGCNKSFDPNHESSHWRWFMERFSKNFSFFDYCYYCSDGNWSDHKKPEGYTEITFEQFQELVLNKTNKQINNKTDEQESNSSNIIKAKRPITTIRQGQRITGSRICGKQSRIAITSRSISYKTVIS